MGDEEYRKWGVGIKKSVYGYYNRFISVCEYNVIYMGESLDAFI